MAAIGAAVDTTEPPRPKCGSVRARTWTVSPPVERTVTRWTDTVCAEAGAACAAAAASSAAEAPARSWSRSSSAGASDSLKLAAGHPKLSPNVASSECSV